jgi:hypothetical protein
MAAPKERANRWRGRHPWAQNCRTNKSRQDLSHLQKKPVKNDTFATSRESQTHYFAETVPPSTQTLRFRNIAQSTQTSRSFKTSSSVGPGFDGPRMLTKTPALICDRGVMLPSLLHDEGVTLCAKN